MRRREREAPAPTPTPGRQSLSLMWSLMSAAASEFRAHGRRVSRTGPVLVPTGYPADFQSVPVRRPTLHGAHFIWSSTWVAYVAYIIQGSAPHRHVVSTFLSSTMLGSHSLPWSSSAVEALSHLTLR
ncbi:hypothetical protein AcV7_006237 [Taiwanofungus camphoratus]|nr:hypothetical protein AcV7_006237 [Antrodia cinnamomea]